MQGLDSSSYVEKIKGYAMATILGNLARKPIYYP
jgi:hypothetical protein